MFIPESLAIGTICTKALNVTTVVDVLFPLVLTCQDILWIACCRVVCNTADHASDHVGWVNCMTDLNSLCGSNEFIVQMLVCILVFNVFMLLAIKVKEHDCVVDFIECQPVMNKALVFCKTCCSKSDEVFDCFSVEPATAVFFQIQRCIEVPDCNEWFDTILLHFKEHTTIEFNAFSVRFLFKTCRIQSGPGNGHSELLESHFRK